jgi:hypothetical protein
LTTPTIIAADRSRARSAGRSALWRRHLWICVVPISLVVYAVSFSDRPIIDQRHSVLAEADAANYALLVSEFSLTRVYGDPYNAHGRSVGDNAQKHKIHHTLYAMLAGYSYRVVRAVYATFGLSAHQALYSMNALITCLNIFLVFLLLKRFNPHANPPVAFVVFYAGSLSTWLYASVPESWPLSATLVLSFLLLLHSGRVRSSGLAVFIGLAMLNNLTLGALLVLVGMADARRATTVPAFFKGLVLCALITVGTWLGALSILSVFDETLRPDRFVAYTLWFKDYVGADLPFYSPYVWKSILTNLFINSVVSNQADPRVPQEALLYTIQGSRLGLAATVTYLVLVAVAVVQAFRVYRATATVRGWPRALLEDDTVYLLLHCGVMVVVTFLLCYCGAFLYSTLVVPIMAVILCRFIDMRKRFQGGLLSATLVLLLMNNLMQVLQFRTALSGML